MSRVGVAQGPTDQTSACLPASAIQSTALKPAVDPLRTNHPEAAIGLDERVTSTFVSSKPRSRRDPGFRSVARENPSGTPRQSESAR